MILHNTNVTVDEYSHLYIYIRIYCIPYGMLFTILLFIVINLVFIYMLGQSMDLHNPWIAQRKPWIHTLRDNPWIARIQGRKYKFADNP